MSTLNNLPLPPFYDPQKAGAVFRVNYHDLFDQALVWRQKYSVQPPAGDKKWLTFMVIDGQNTFGTPGFELYVGGRSGTGAVDDSRRMAEFIYADLPHISNIVLSLDTHFVMQIFHRMFWIDAKGNHPTPNVTVITQDDVLAKRWRVNPAVAPYVANGNLALLERYALHYTQRLAEGGRYPLTIWTEHGILGGIGHALVSILEEAVFFWSVVRQAQPTFEVKGGNFLTENYSILHPEVMDGPSGEPIAQMNTRLVQTLMRSDYVVEGGWASSHCWAWTIQDYLNELKAKDASLVRKVYLPRLFTSPVVIPGVVDYTDKADAAFAQFASEGMHVVSGDEPLSDWPGMAF